jgi:hypothetical protein
LQPGNFGTVKIFMTATLLVEILNTFSIARLTEQTLLSAKEFHGPFAILYVFKKIDLFGIYALNDLF